MSSDGVECVQVARCRSSPVRTVAASAETIAATDTTTVGTTATNSAAVRAKFASSMPQTSGFLTKLE